MAEQPETEAFSSSSQNLTCPLCLEIFDVATIMTSCRHTFCLKCLKQYDLAHQNLDYMVCPLCMAISKFTSTNRVDDFLANVTVNGLVDDYYAKCGGMNAALEMRPKCTGCKFQRDAISFCKTCNIYMCINCDHSHKQLTIFFEGHKIIPNDDIIKGTVIAGHSSDKCYIHKQEDKDMYCEDCKVHFCLKCVIDRHKNHTIKNRADFERELRLEVNDLVQRVATRKSELEKNIQNIELQRHEVDSAMQKLREDVNQAYSIKVKELEENHRKLSEEINAFQHSFHDDLNTLKSKDRQRIKSICSSIKLVDKNRLGHLETDTLSAHALLCEELDAVLKKYVH
nr:E3 ubiquitin-protein ligase TRIM33-like [Lytechinus pictus]